MTYLEGGEGLLGGGVNGEDHTQLAVSVPLRPTELAIVLCVVHTEKVTYSPCSQKNHRGAVAGEQRSISGPHLGVMDAPLSIWIVHSGVLPAVALAGMYPEFTPAGLSVQGSANVDWVTVCN